jgi:hypothetical protein
LTITENDLKNPLHWIRWSLNAGIITDQIKDTLYGYAYLIHLDIRAAEVSIDANTKTINYKVYLSKKLDKAIKAYRSNLQSGGIIALWKAKRLVKKHGNLELEKVLKDFVDRFCGPGWTIVLTTDVEVNYIAADDRLKIAGNSPISNG